MRLRLLSTRSSFLIMTEQYHAKNAGDDTSFQQTTYQSSDETVVEVQEKKKFNMLKWYIHVF